MNLHGGLSFRYFGATEVGIELLTPLDHPVLVGDVRTVLFFH